MTEPAQDLEVLLRRAELSAEEARRECARLWAENARLHAERREIEAYEARMAHMEGSVSWKLTEPLRTAKTLYVKLQRRLADPSR